MGIYVVDDRGLLHEDPVIAGPDWELRYFDKGLARLAVQEGGRPKGAVRRHAAAAIKKNGIAGRLSGQPEHLLYDFGGYSARSLVWDVEITAPLPSRLLGCGVRQPPAAAVVDDFGRLWG